MNKLSIIVPCYNEQEVLPKSAFVLLAILNTLIADGLISPESFICFIDDGSTDETWNIVNSLHEQEPIHFCGLSLSRNFGHQSALLAGLHTIEADIYITIDADLQDDENSIVDMINAFHQGFDIVYGVRKERRTDSFFKKSTALGFYKIMSLLGTHTIYNHADYRLPFFLSTKGISNTTVSAS